MANDSLASGARSAQFPPAKISQERWDKIWAEEKFQEVECVPLKTCSGYGESFHKKTRTNNGCCPICGAVGMTMQVKKAEADETDS